MRNRDRRSYGNNENEKLMNESIMRDRNNTRMTTIEHNNSHRTNKTH